MIGSAVSVSGGVNDNDWHCSLKTASQWTDTSVSATATDTARPCPVSTMIQSFVPDVCPVCGLETPVWSEQTHPPHQRCHCPHSHTQSNCHTTQTSLAESSGKLEKTHSGCQDVLQHLITKASTEGRVAQLDTRNEPPKKLVWRPSCPPLIILIIFH